MFNQKYHRVPIVAMAAVGATFLMGSISGGVALAAPVPAPFTSITFGEMGAATGDGSVSTSPAPQTEISYAGTDLDGLSLTNVVGLEGGRAVLALSDTGQILSWGDNTRGTLGNGSKTNQPVATYLDTTGTPLEGKVVTAIAGGETSAYALTSDNLLVSWGTDRFGSLGQGPGVAESLRPGLVAVTGTALEGKTVVALSMLSYGGVIVQTDDGDLFGWGANGEVGTLVAGGAAAQPIPVQIPTDGTPLEGKYIVPLASSPLAPDGDVVATVLTTDGVAVSWGDKLSPNLSGQPSASSTPAVIPALSGVNVVEIAASPQAASMIARTNTGAVYTWGSGAWSGQGTTDDVPEPTLLTLPDSARQIAVTRGAGYAVLENGEIAAWGIGGRGQLGGGVQPDAPTPVLIPRTTLPLEGFSITNLVATNAGVIVFGVKPAAIVPVEIVSPEEGSSTTLRPVLSGSGEPLATVTLFEGAVELGETTVSQAGQWTFTPTADLTEGSHTLEARQSTDGSSDRVTINATAPVIEPVTITGPTGTETTLVRPTITGNGEPGATITLTEGPTNLGSTLVNDEGKWAITPGIDLTIGEHVLSATQDVDGSSDSLTLTVITKTGPGTDPTTPANGNGGTVNDGSLAATGGEVSPLWFTALIILLVGSALALLRRRRRVVVEESE